MFKSRKKVLKAIACILIISFCLWALNGLISSNKTDILLEDVEEIDTIIKPSPKSFDELMVASEYKELRDSLYLVSKKIVESGLNDSAFNKRELARGVLQIRPIMVRECNNILAKNGETRRYQDSDCFNPVKAEEIYWIVQNEHNPDFDLFTASSVWNGGHRPSKLKGNTIKNVENYHRKVMSEMRHQYRFTHGDSNSI